MSYQNEAILRDKNGAPIPQYNDTKRPGFGDLKGSDGASHTKIVDKNGVPIEKMSVEANFPEVQDVKDADVRSELEEIKQTQSEILTRLDSPIDTQVTGSNMEDGIEVNQVGNISLIKAESSLTISAGSTYSFEFYHDKYTKVTLFFRKVDAVVQVHSRLNRLLSNPGSVASSLGAETFNRISHVRSISSVDEITMRNELLITNEGAEDILCSFELVGSV